MKHKHPPLSAEQQESVITYYALSPTTFNLLTPLAMHALWDAIPSDAAGKAAGKAATDTTKGYNKGETS